MESYNIILENLFRNSVFQETTRYSLNNGILKEARRYWSGLLERNDFEKEFSNWSFPEQTKFLE